MPINRSFLVSIWIALLLSPLASPSWAFNVGPYKLAMSNASAKKLGFEYCEQDPSTSRFIRCSIQKSLSSITTGVEKAYIHFDKSFRTIKAINVTLSKVPFDFAMERLSIAKVADHVQNDGLRGWSYQLPNQARLITTEGPCIWRYCDKTTDLIHIRMEIDPAHVRGYLNTKKQMAQAERDISHIESGR